MSNETLVLIILIALVVGALPAWPYSRSWGYTPTGVLGLILAVLVIWALMGNREVRSTGDDISSGVHEAAHDVKELGHDVKESVHDAVH